MGAAKRLVSVLLVDGHALVREGYRRLLERRGDIVVTGEASSAKEAIELFRKLSPHVVVMNITLPGVSGIEAMRWMLAQRALDPRVLIFSKYEDTIFAHRAFESGALGYVTKASAPAALVDAVHCVAQGRKYLSPQTAQDLALRAAALDMPAGDRLSTREFEVLRLLIRGQSVHDIGESMQLTAETVVGYRSAIKHKLSLDSAAQLLQLARQMGLDLPRLR